MYKYSGCKINIIYSSMKSLKNHVKSPQFNENIIFCHLIFAFQIKPIFTVLDSLVIERGNKQTVYYNTYYEIITILSSIHTRGLVLMCYLFSIRFVYFINSQEYLRVGFLVRTIFCFFFFLIWSACPSWCHVP